MKSENKVLAKPRPLFSERIWIIRRVAAALLEGRDNEIADVPENIGTITESVASCIVNAYIENNQEKLSKEQVMAALLRRKVKLANGKIDVLPMSIELRASIYEQK